MKRITLLVLYLGIALFMTGCSEDTIGLDSSRSTGEITIQLDQAAIGGVTKAPGLAISDFSVEILNSAGTTIHSWNRFSDVPSKVKITEGNYTLRAWCGDKDGTGFDAAYYLGETVFTIVRQQTKQITAVCKLANVKVAITYGDNIKRDYKNFYVDVRSQTHPIVSFGKDETRPGYMPVGQLQLKVYLTDLDGAFRSYVPEPITAGSNDFVKLSIDTKENDGNLSFNISLNPDTEGGEEISFDLPAFMGNFDKPTIEYEGFDPSTGLLIVEDGEITPSARVNLRADGAIRKCEINVHSAELTAQGWPAKFDLANLDAPTEILLKSKGLKWFSDTEGAAFSYIDFTGVYREMQQTGGTSFTSFFSVYMTDSFSQLSDIKFVSIMPLPAYFFISEPAPGDAWASKADLKINATGGDPENLQLQYKKASESTWTNTTLQNISSSGQSISGALKGLTPDTEYEVRLRYDGFASEKVSIVSEEAVQIPNSNFENSYQYKFNDADNLAQYYWAAQNDPDPWWQTRNPASASQKSKSLLAGYYPYTRNNGTEPVSTDTGNGVRLRTTSWGRGNDVGNTKYNITSALLFIGSYNYNLTETGNTLQAGKGVMDWETITQGHTFSSRPAAVKIDYKYTPASGESFAAYAVIENRDEGVVLGRAEVPAATASQTVVTMTDLKLNFVYDPQYTALKATHISIFFGSSTKMGWLDGQDRPAVPNRSGSSNNTFYYGSELIIDNLELDYVF